ncbi:kinase-like domain-containing protein [Whalleya microplaca]|nr:kinase-like domain-containing protein [Whalleya microplaca]
MSSSITTPPISHPMEDLGEPAEITEDIVVNRGTGELIEDISDYTEGGHHPVHLGDILNNRFEVIHKLGQGGFAIVWLCFDNLNHDWKAIKILAADDSDEDCPDLKFLNILRNSDQKPYDWEASHIVLPSEHFWVSGPNGRHLCLVMPLLGPRLDAATRGEPSRVRKLLLQTARGLQYLHHHGLCHGDFRPNNILLRVKDNSHISKEKMLELLGQPEVEELRTISGKLPGPNYPKYAVCQVENISCLGLADEVAIIDFGGSFHVESPPDFVGIPNKYAAPEARFRLKPGFSSDVWSLACSIMEIRVGKAILGDSEQEYICSLEQLLGPLPEPYRSVLATRRKKYQEEHGEDPFEGFAEGNEPNDTLGPVSPRDEYESVMQSYEEDSKLLGHEGVIRIELAGEQQYHDYPRNSDGTRDRSRSMTLVHFKVPDAEVRMLGGLLESVLKYDPKDRIDIDAVLEHPWFRQPEASLKESSCPEIAISQDSNAEQQCQEDLKSSLAIPEELNVIKTAPESTEHCNIDAASKRQEEHKRISIFRLPNRLDIRHYWEKARPSQIFRKWQATLPQRLLLPLSLGFTIAFVFWAIFLTISFYRRPVVVVHSPDPFKPCHQDVLLIPATARPPAST